MTYVDKKKNNKKITHKNMTLDTTGVFECQIKKF